MNQTLEVIKSRRSIRKYKEEQITEQELQAIIEAGLYAPSSHNGQTWNFTVIQNRELLQELNRETKELAKGIDNEFLQKIANDPDYDIFYGAPTGIIVSGQADSLAAKVDCAAATENMLLAAESLNIGSCWIGLIGILLSSEKGEEYRQRLEIPEGYNPFHAIALGYKGEPQPEAPERKANTVQYIK